VLFLYLAGPQPPAPSWLLPGQVADLHEGIGEERHPGDELKEAQDDVLEAGIGLYSGHYPDDEGQDGQGEGEGVDDGDAPALPGHWAPAPPEFSGLEPPLLLFSFRLRHGLII